MPLIKSGLHLDFDLPAAPVRKLMNEIAQTVGPKVFVTTGPGGGIGSDVALGDVAIAGPSCLPAGALDAITPDLTKGNAARVTGGRAIPEIWASSDDTVVTTDFFGFDDSTDCYRLQGSGARACDMGDAMVGDAMQKFPGTQWCSIRRGPLLMQVSIRNQGAYSWQRNASNTRQRLESCHAAGMPPIPS